MFEGSIVAFPPNPAKPRRITIMLNIVDRVRKMEAGHDELSAKVVLLEAANAELEAENARLVAQLAAIKAALGPRQ